MEESQPVDRTVELAPKAKARKKSFSELFSTEEIVQYGSAILVYIALGVLLTDKVLNFVVGPLFFIGWIWLVPPLWSRLRGGR